MSAELAAALVETHTATVVFLGDRAYKVKKPVDLGFLDFSTLESRRVACQREVELNRRLAPDVYLGVSTVHDEHGAPCEYIVVMRRMPPDRRLARCIEGGEDVTDAVRDVARAIAALHLASPPADEWAKVARVAAVRRIWDDGFDQVRPLVGTVLAADGFARTETLVHRYLDGRGSLFTERISSGWVVDGHGDLQADDIFVLPDGPRILDCIEFSDELRWGDALGDVSFLAMDLERLGRPDLAQRFLAWHREFTADTWPASLAHHYIAQRAFVRAKVMAIRHTQGDVDARVRANEFLELARQHLEAGRVRVVLIGGLPGTGKSTLAAALADRADAVVVRSDEMRPARSDRYLPEAIDENYRRLLERAGRLLALGETVIVDATWASARHRAQARSIAGETSSELVELECRVPAAVAHARIASRARAGDDPSEATPAVATAMASRFEAWPEATVVDTHRPIEDCVLDALDALDRERS